MLACLGDCGKVNETCDFACYTHAHACRGCCSYDEKTLRLTVKGTTFAVFDRVAVQVSVEEKMQTKRIRLKLVRPVIDGVSVEPQASTSAAILRDAHGEAPMAIESPPAGAAAAAAPSMATSPEKKKKKKKKSGKGEKRPNTEDIDETPPKKHQSEKGKKKKK